jgi:phosphoribosylformylglycinamidine cyclo-ligase
MYRTFNCGVGMVVCVAEADASRALAHLSSAGEDARVIGHVAQCKGAPVVKYMG